MRLTVEYIEIRFIRCLHGDRDLKVYQVRTYGRGGPLPSGGIHILSCPPGAEPFFDEALEAARAERAELHEFLIEQWEERGRKGKKPKRPKIWLKSGYGKGKLHER